MDFVGGFRYPQTVPNLVRPNRAEPIPEMLYWETSSVIFTLQHHNDRAAVKDLSVMVLAGISRRCRS